MGEPVELHHQSLGRGPPLVVLHGLFGSGTNWRSIARGLADCRTVHLLDLRNHGESPHAEPMDYAHLAADVSAFLDAKGLERTDVIGHSMGGKTAMRLALGAPRRVARLMVVDIAPAPSDSDHDRLIDVLLALPLEGLTRRAEADAALSRSVPDPGLRAFLLQNLKSGDTGLRWRIDLPALRRAMPALLDFPLGPDERFAGEALFVRGGASDFVREEHRSLIARHFPAARLETVAGAGHWLHAEDPAGFLRLARAQFGCGAPSVA